MSTFSTPIPLVVAGAAQGPASGQQWEGGDGVLFTSGGGAGPYAFQATVDGGVTWVPITNLASGVLMTALAADGAYPFMLAPCRIRVSGTLTTMNAYAGRID